MGVLRPGGRGGNFAALSRHSDHGVPIHMASGKHNGMRRPATRLVSNETYQSKAHSTYIRTAGSTAAVQRGS